MYKVVDKIPKNWDPDTRTALVVLEDEYGGQSVISRDDHCFVLLNGSDNDTCKFRMTHHWYKEAAQALVQFIQDNPKFQL